MLICPWIASRFIRTILGKTPLYISTDFVINFWITERHYTLLYICWIDRDMKVSREASVMIKMVIVVKDLECISKRCCQWLGVISTLMTMCGNIWLSVFYKQGCWCDCRETWPVSWWKAYITKHSISQWFVLIFKIWLGVIDPPWLIG